MVDAHGRDRRGVLYVTHHLGEVFRVGHRLSVLRDGVARRQRPGQRSSTTTRSSISSSARNSRPEERRPGPSATAHAAQPPGAARLEVEELRGGAVAGVSLARRSRVRSSGSPASRDQAATISSAASSAPSRERGGRVRVAGQELSTSRPDLAIGKGVAYLAPDRKTSGGVMNMTARENLTMPNLRPFWKGLLLRRKLETEPVPQSGSSGSACAPRERYDEPLSIFSGGNQQKVLFGKWLSQAPSVFLLDEPTQGVDVGREGGPPSRAAHGRRGSGAAVVISSSDLEELADLCNRVARPRRRRRRGRAVGQRP